MPPGNGTRRLRLALSVIACDAAELRGNCDSREKLMGDKSPKSQKRQQQQKQALKTNDAANAKAKQDKAGSPPPPAKGKK
jgi:hypothetical protein